MYRDFSFFVKYMVSGMVYREMLLKAIVVLGGFFEIATLFPLTLLGASAKKSLMNLKIKAYQKVGLTVLSKRD